MIGGIIQVRPDIEIRDRRILILYHRGVIRKKIAIMMQMQYEAIKKVIQKVERRQTPR